MRRDYTAANFKRAEDCRWCGKPDPQLHHIVNRSLGGDENPDNLCPLCAECHGMVHAKLLDLARVLTKPEQAHAVSVLGLSRAHRLLCPTEYREKAAA